MAGLGLTYIALSERIMVRQQKLMTYCSIKSVGEKIMSGGHKNNINKKEIDELL